jgi:hypothetical protein
VSFKKKFKTIFDPFINTLVVNEKSWKLVATLLRIGEWFQFRRSQYQHQVAQKLLMSYFQDKIVQHGFFKGLKYPSFQSCGSSIFPKLFGSYEYELYSTLLKFEGNNYSEIIDIGCAEGFYAVGLALKFPNAGIYAYDIDRKALEYCKLMAFENKVADRVNLGSCCTTETLRNFHFTGRGLIVCDCEGYERELFSDANISSFKLTDLIIELHTFVHQDVKDYLVSLFENSHNYTLITSHDNNRKMLDFKPYLNNMNKAVHLKAIEEGRPTTMDWLILTPKTASKA